MATQIGIVKALIGTVTATAADGSIRNLNVGDSVYADELVSTGTGGAIEIEFADGSVMDLGRDTQALLDNAVFDPEAVAETASPAESDVDAIQAAILAGADPTQVTEATAAGAGTQAEGNEGHQPVVIDYLAPQVTPTSGFDTTGISVAFPEIIEELQAPIEEAPIVSVSVAVDVAIGTPTPGDEQDDVILIPPGTVIPVGVSAVNIPEGTSDGGSHPVTFLITLSQASTQPVSMHYNVIAGTALNPEDFFDGNLEGDVVIPAGYLGFTVTVNIREDHLDEDNETFSIQLSDVVGATLLNGTATVTIIDDDTTPVAQDDFNAVTEDGGQGFPQTTGNVISGANDAANDPAAQQDTDQDGDALQIVSFSDADETSVAGGTITGMYGELTLNLDGSYTYVLTSNEDPAIQGLSDGETLTDVFSYIVTDTYNAQQTANLTIVIQGADDGVTLTGLSGEGAEQSVSEANLVDGSDPDNIELTQSGNFGFEAKDGLDVISIGGQDFDLAALNALDGTQEITTPYGTLTLLGFVGDAFGGTISYQYTLDNNVDNDSQANATDGGYTDSFAVVVTDEDGSTTNDSLDIFIADDTPTAVDDGPASVTEDATSFVSGDVLSNDDANADQTATFVSWGSDQANLDAIAALNTYGTLVQNANGTWNYTLNNADADTQALTAADHLSYDLTYTMADADGDTAAAKLTITIDGADDTASVVTAQAEGPDATVYEAGLNPDGSDAGNDSETVTGSFTVSASDGILNVVIGGTTYTLAEVQAFNGSNTVSTGEGTLTLVSYTGDAMSGTINYSYTLDATIDNDSKVPVGDDAVTLANFDDSVALTVNGIGGSTASDDLVIRAVDDLPTANDDGPEAVTEDATSFVSGDVLSNDDANADQVAAFVGWGSEPADLAAIAALNTYGTLVQNGDGTWSYTLNNADVDTQALTAADHLSYDLTYTMADADGDTAPAKLTITIDGADDSASVVTAQATGPDATVYEAGLTDGSSLDKTLDTTVGSFTVSATDGILNVVIGGTAFTFAELAAADGTAPYQINTGEGVLIITGYTGNAMGGTVDYSYTLSATIDNDSKVPVGDDAVTLVNFDDSVELRVNGLGGSTASDDLVIRAIDDAPVAYTPTAGLLENDGIFSVTESLNTIGALGADTYGGTTNVIFSTAQEGGSGLTSGGDTIYYYVSEDGKTLTGSTSVTEIGVTTGNTIFTVAISDSTDEYTMTMSGSIDNGSGASFGNLSGTGEAGNPSFKIVESTSADTLEILFTPLGTATSVNSDSDDVGVGSQFIKDGDGLRIDFGTFSNDSKGTNTGQDDTLVIDTKETINGFRFGINQISVGTTATIMLAAYDAEHPFDQILNNDTPDDIDRIEIYSTDASGTPLAIWNDGDGSITVNGITFTDNGDGTVSVSDLLAGYNIATYTDDGYDGIQVWNDATDGTDGKFSLDNLQVLNTSSGDPISQSFDTVLTDADGDTSTGTINVTLAPDAVTHLGTSDSDNLVGTAGEDIMYGGAGDDILTGGQGDDLLTGGLGADQFVWVNGDTGTDTITDFNADEGDVLNLADLLDPTTALDIGGADSLDDYLKANFDVGTNTTTIDVYTGGDANAAGTIAQSILINGDVSDLNSLLGTNNLIVDQ